MFQIKVHQCIYHRNGISGIGFYAVGFSYEEDGKKRMAVATVNAFDIDAFKSKEPHDPDTRILMLAEDGGLAIEETMRGDRFHDQLCTWIIADRSKK